MDDFGTGYSSLSYLRSFPFDKIKIDQSFIRDLPHDKDAVAIVQAITALGSALGMAIMAEGVERPEQLRRLHAEGCTEVQGFLFSGPARRWRNSRTCSARLHTSRPPTERQVDAKVSGARREHVIRSPRPARHVPIAAGRNPAASRALIALVDPCPSAASPT